LLKLLSAQSVISGGLIAGGPWAVAIPSSDKLKFWGIVRGHCWLVLEGQDAPVAGSEGDVFLLRAARPHVIASSLDVAPIDLEQL
ncbi:cupin domain-containing protein, partial [Mesorhizobium japonicum]|uniref:cupin domain-containing protein n=1 Tax=Mesorhizobium japonicum TaxID=2066070 RepID=UPI003B5B61DA